MLNCNWLLRYISIFCSSKMFRSYSYVYLLYLFSIGNRPKGHIAVCSIAYSIHEQAIFTKFHNDWVKIVCSIMLFITNKKFKQANFVFSIMFNNWLLRYISIFCSSKMFRSYSYVLSWNGLDVAQQKQRFGNQNYIYLSIQNINRGI